MKLLITSTLLFLAFSPLALAKHDRSSHNNSAHYLGEYKAKVVSSTPIYKYVTVSQPHTYCEAATVYTTRQSHDKGGAVIGGVLGGVIGHAVSDHKHKGLGTLVGAVIGSSLGHNITHSNNKHTPNYQVGQQNCVAKYKKPSKVRVLDGYNVIYRSQGKLYKTFRQDKPTKYIRIYG
jgi:uncharacterized protein YcfJ